MDKGKRQALLDRISNLPDNVVDIILGKLKLQDAVRTSILSRRWRLCWTRVQDLVFNTVFINAFKYDKYGGWKEVLPAYVQAVDKVLLSHCGSICKLVLSFPCPGGILLSDTVNRWVLVASRCKVQALTLDYTHQFRVRVPSYLFQCTELKHLSLTNVSLPPFDFGDLPSLVSLNFSLTSGEVDKDLITNFILSCPLLEKMSLHFRDCPPLSINASKLKHLHVTYGKNINLILTNTPRISIIHLESMRYGDSHIECQTIVDFFGALPKVGIVTLNNGILEKWSQQGVPKRLPVNLENHFSLTVCSLDILSAATVQALFCIVKSSPKLQTLIISMSSFSSPVIQDSVEYLESQVRETGNLWPLRIVMITNLMGCKSEIAFVKVILSCCPKLEELHLESSPDLETKSESKMKTKILRLRRASTQVEVIYMDLNLSESDSDY